MCLSVITPRVDGLFGTTVCISLDPFDIIFGVGNVGLMPGFSDMFSVLMLMPAAVALTVTMILSYDFGGIGVTLTPLFENLSFLLPVVIFVRSGLMSVELGLIVVSVDLVDMCILMESSQWN